MKTKRKRRAGIKPKGNATRKPAKKGKPSARDALRKRPKERGPARLTHKQRKGKLKRVIDTKNRLDRQTAAIMTIGSPKGRMEVGETRWLTPTKQGFNAVDRMVEGISKSRRLKGGRYGVTLYSFDLFITFTGKDGKPVNKTTLDVGVPIIERIAKRKGLTKLEVLQQMIRETVRTTVYGILSDHFDVISPGKHTGQKLSKQQAVKMMEDIRRGRNTRFKLTLYRRQVK